MNSGLEAKLRYLWDAALYRLKLLASGRTDFLWYTIRSRLKGYDLTPVPLEELGLSPERSVLHGDSGGPDLENILRCIAIPPGSRVVDFGSGKGGAILTLSEFPFTEIVGVELSPALIRIAGSNIRRARLKQVTFVQVDAANFTDLDRFTHVYMYHPFPCNVVAEVMANLAESIARIERDLTLIYTNPVCHDAVLGSSLFKADREFDGRYMARVYLHKAPRRE